MSFVSDFLFGEDPEPARIEDVRTPQQIAQQGQSLGALQDIIGQGGLPGFQGPLAAPIGGAEQDLLDTLTQFQSGSFPGIGVARQTLQDLQTPGGAGTQLNPIFAEGGQRPGQQRQAFDQIFDILTGASQTSDNPALQGAITAATRPILEQFADRGDINRNLFTQAGQFVQPGSSSPFELAQSRLDVGLANALGDTGANLAFQNLQQERGRQADLIGLLSGAFEGQQQRAGAAENRRLAAAGQTVPFERGQIQGLGEALDIQALPRLIEQFGITQGQDEFARQQQTLLESLRLALSGNQPQIATIPGSEGSGGLLGSVAPAFGAALGGPAGGALASAIFG